MPHVDVSYKNNEAVVHTLEGFKLFRNSNLCLRSNFLLIQSDYYIIIMNTQCTGIVWNWLSLKIHRGFQVSSTARANSEHCVPWSPKQATMTALNVTQTKENRATKVRLSRTHLKQNHIISSLSIFNCHCRPRSVAELSVTGTTTTGREQSSAPVGLSGKDEIDTDRENDRSSPGTQTSISSSRSDVSAL